MLILSSQNPQSDGLLEILAIVASIVSVVIAGVALIRQWRAGIVQQRFDEEQQRISKEQTSLSEEQNRLAAKQNEIAREQNRLQREQNELAKRAADARIEASTASRKIAEEQLKLQKAVTTIRLAEAQAKQETDLELTPYRGARDIISLTVENSGSAVARNIQLEVLSSGFSLLDKKALPYPKLAPGRQFVIKSILVYEGEVPIRIAVKWTDANGESAKKTETFTI